MFFAHYLDRMHVLSGPDLAERGNRRAGARRRGWHGRQPEAVLALRRDAGDRRVPHQEQKDRTPADVVSRLLSHLWPRALPTSADPLPRSRACTATRGATADSRRCRRISTDTSLHRLRRDEHPAARLRPSRRLAEVSACVAARPLRLARRRTGGDREVRRPLRQLPPDEDRGSAQLAEEPRLSEHATGASGAEAHAKSFVHRHTRDRAAVDLVHRCHQTMLTLPCRQAALRVRIQRPEACHPTELLPLVPYRISPRALRTESLRLHPLGGAPGGAEVQGADRAGGSVPQRTPVRRLRCDRHRPAGVRPRR